MNYDEIINNQHLGREEKITALKLIIEKSQKCLDIMECSKPPKQLPFKDYSDLEELCYSYLLKIQNNETFDKNKELHRIFETAMTTIFGENIFKWIEEHNKNQKKINNKKFNRGINNELLFYKL